MPGLNPDQREDARLMAAEMELYPARRLAIAAELIRLRTLEHALRRHPRLQHPDVERALKDLRENRGDIAPLLDEDLDHDRLIESTPPRRPR